MRGGIPWAGAESERTTNDTSRSVVAGGEREGVSTEGKEGEGKGGESHPPVTRRMSFSRETGQLAHTPAGCKDGGKEIDGKEGRRGDGEGFSAGIGIGTLSSVPVSCCLRSIWKRVCREGDKDGRETISPCLVLAQLRPAQLMVWEGEQ